MDPVNIPFNALIVGPTNPGKTQFLVNHICGTFCGKFDYIVPICPTFAYNRTLYRFGERDPRLEVIICEQHQVEIWLKAASFVFEGTNTLIVLEDCAASKDVKGRTGEPVKLGFSARHAGVSVWGVDSAAVQHREASPRKRDSNSSFLHAISQDHKGNL